MRHFTEHTLQAATADAAEPIGRVIFAGTPAIAADCLDGLLAAGVDVVGVLTRPDASLGRKRRLTPSPVAQRAEAAGLPVIKASRVDDEVAAQLGTLEAELGVVVAYGALLPQHALDLPRRGWVNLHYSWLPKHRGAAPVQHAILNGDEVTAATVFQLEAGMDTGPVHALCEYPIPPGQSAGTVLNEMTRLGTSLLQVLLDDLLAGRSEPVAQRGQPTFAPKLGREEAFISPSAPAPEVTRRINATIPEPGAWTLAGQDRVKLGVARMYQTPGALGQDFAGAAVGTVMQVPADRRPTGTVVALRTGDGGAVVLSAVQLAGKRMMNATDWHRGLQRRVILGPEAEEPDPASPPGADAQSIEKGQDT